MSEFEPLVDELDRSFRNRADEFWDQSLIVQFHNGAFLSNQGRIDFKKASEFNNEVTRFYLGQAQGQHFFAVDQAFEFNGMTLREMAPNLSNRDISIAMQTQSLINWHETHTNCSRCGAPTKVIAHGWIRECEIDGSQHFPRTDPAVIVLVRDRANRLLLGRQKVWQEGKFSNFAGFVEPGESLESAVRREVEEESGLKVSEIKYLASQPWPFPASIMLAFEAIAENPDDAKADGEEIVELYWFTKEDIRAGKIILPDHLSVSRKMIDYWLAND